MISPLIVGILLTALVTTLVLVLATKHTVEGYEDKTGFHLATLNAHSKPDSPTCRTSAPWAKLKVMPLEAGDGI